MKNYEKPRLTMLSLSGNSALCACAIDAVGPNMNEDLKFALGAFVDDPSEIANCFETGSACTIKVDVGGYCKFGPGGQIVFNS